MARRGLGKGLDALFQTYESNDDELEVESKGILELQVHIIDPNMEQPRRSFDQGAINELSKSILEHGIIQPILVKPNGNRYIIIAGERRWRAARIAGIDKIPAIILDLNQKAMLEVALIENLQRQDLNPMEEAEGISSLMKNHGLTQEEVAQRLGRSRPAIANALRLLRLPAEVKALLEEGSINTGHARAILGLSDDQKRIEVGKLIVENNLSVREVENLIKRIKNKRVDKRKASQRVRPSFILDLEARMEESLGTKVTIQPGKKKGVIGIEYYSNEDLERIMEVISKA